MRNGPSNINNQAPGDILIYSAYRNQKKIILFFSVSSALDTNTFRGRVRGKMTDVSLATVVLLYLSPTCHSQRQSLPNATAKTQCIYVNDT